MEEFEKKIIYAKIDGIMSSDSLINLNATLLNGEKINLKLNESEMDGIFLNCIYEFEAAKHQNQEKNSMFVLSHKSVNEIEDSTTRDKVFRAFMKSSPITYEDLKLRIESYIAKIDNNILKEITNNILEKYKDDFFLYPAASKLHHAYIGGLAYHTLGMLDLVEGFKKVYPYINEDYMYAGIILHDMGKVIEFSGVENTEYALEGQLLGHLAIGIIQINEEAKHLGYEKTEEVLMLEHMIASHHGQPNFGAIKKPAIAEAALLWYIDTIDSKFRVLGEELNKIKPGEFTDIIGVMDRTKFYKHK